ncbi:LysE/ArgO family amino acid transporter [Actinokineospora globicatena]|uniref:Amino acid transporter n=1 Tax=Actinokineospora globicatena TaxID=103729 RepID=A0A9W6QM26_9PSEU|nr:LysE/ArgO family amino acid transporter [Actinokineospora globicatena]MCP2304447.1 L-lysine exporter family protein LysE/ArgO [Actinokineospora globicatena]GLW78187.1 amino acid transporter [Actinokineospora globicatena]GLW85147.1 amino acid transporter [Actinokineospora globicatena]GLW90793.1 amino acid transporter [Actinokineospora globicatena]
MGLAVLAGFGTGLSLIIAIGSQNAFVLRQGILRQSVLPVVVICAVSDAVLIALGVGGMGAVVAAQPVALTVVAIVGGLFLLGYGLLAAKRAVRPSALSTTGTGAGSTRTAVLTCLGLTWLNPHVYLDTVLLLGTIAAAQGSARWAFAVGATLASVCWFAGLGFGARLLTPVFARAASWRVLDAVIAVTMTALGVSLVVGA